MPLQSIWDGKGTDYLKRALIVVSGDSYADESLLRWLMG